MEKKKLKLSISGSQKRTLTSIEQAKSHSKNTVVIEKRSGKIHRKQPQNKFVRNNNFQKSTYVNNTSKPPPVFQQNTKSDFEKRKLAEQRATKRLKGENGQKETKGKNLAKRRELKLTLSRALSEEDSISKSRSIASLRRAKQKENRELNKDYKVDIKPVKREINIPKMITIRELANRMAEQSSSIIKHLLGIGLTVTINHTIDEDTAEYLVKEFGHTPIKEKKADEIIEKIKTTKVENLKA